MHNFTADTDVPFDLVSLDLYNASIKAYNNMCCSLSIPYRVNLIQELHKN